MIVRLEPITAIVVAVLLGWAQKIDPVSYGGLT